LETANIPFINKIINLPFGGRSPFTAEVWYINKVHSLDIKWGTPTPIQLQDPKYKVFVPLRSFGQFGIQIEDSKKFLTKLVGTLSVFDKQSILSYFRGLYLTKVKDAISSYLIKRGISALEINAYLDELSEHLKERIIPTLDEYGIKLLNFYVNDINLPEEDPAVKKLKDALAKRAEMDIVGYSYVQERSFDTLEGAATNPNGGQSGLMGAGIGLGMGVGIGGAMGANLGGLAQSINTREVKKCVSCNFDFDASQRFCPSCGNDSYKAAATGSEDGMTGCSDCGNRYSKKAKFCPECGSSYHPCAYCGEDRKTELSPCPKCGRSASKQCPKCSTVVEDNMKFCFECGEPLTKQCSHCGAKLEGSPKFCPDCGTKLSGGL
jgi:membrane protease subunit (stomatin/prohibitin family)